MAGRPPKASMDFSSWETDIFDNDTKIDKLLDAQGAAGFLVFFYLCQKAYGSNGYFFAWCYDDAATTARKIGGGVGAGTVKEAVGYCLQIGLFNKGLFDRWGVLTSRGIQKRYLPIHKARVGVTINPNYWLLTEAESQGIDFELSEINYAPPKSNYQPPKSNYAKQRVDKSKVKESIKDDLSAPAREPAPPSSFNPNRAKDLCQQYAPTYFKSDHDYSRHDFTAFYEAVDDLENPLTEETLTVLLQKSEQSEWIKKKWEKVTLKGLLNNRQKIISGEFGKIFGKKEEPGENGSGKQVYIPDHIKKRI